MRKVSLPVWPLCLCQKWHMWWDFRVGSIVGVGQTILNVAERPRKKLEVRTARNVAAKAAGRVERVHSTFFRLVLGSSLSTWGGKWCGVRSGNIRCENLFHRWFLLLHVLLLFVWRRRKWMLRQSESKGQDLLGGSVTDQHACISNNLLLRLWATASKCWK